MKAIKERIRIFIIYLVLKWMKRYKVGMMTMDHVTNHEGEELVMIGIKYHESDDVCFDYFDSETGQHKETYVLPVQVVHKISLGEL